MKKIEVLNCMGKIIHIEDDIPEIDYWKVYHEMERHYSGYRGVWLR